MHLWKCLYSMNCYFCSFLFLFFLPSLFSMDVLFFYSVSLEQTAGTDDDLPPSHQNRLARGVRVSGNGRAVGAVAYPRVQNDMETQIHRLEQEAYSSVLRAFKAQSDAITWVFCHSHDTNAALLLVLL